MKTDNFSVKDLINLMPVERQLKDEFLKIEPELTAEARYKLSKTCWLILLMLKRETYRDMALTAVRNLAEGTIKEFPQKINKWPQEFVDSLKDRLPKEKEGEKSVFRQQLKKLMNQIAST